MNTLKLQKLVEKFIGYDCEVIYDKEGFYYYPYDTVVITLNDKMEDNLVWKKHLKEEFNFNLTKENLFTLSVLHELGHHYTLESLSEEEQERDIIAETIKNALISTGKKEVSFSSEELQMIYFNSPREKIATQWAIEVYNSNLVAMRHWNHRFNCMIRHYGKKMKPQK